MMKRMKLVKLMMPLVIQADEDIDDEADEMDIKADEDIGERG